MNNPFVSTLDSSHIRIMHTKSNNVECMSRIETNDIINELFESIFKRYQENLETKMKGNSFLFERVDLLHYIFHKKKHE